MTAGGSATVTANGYSDPNCGKNQIIVIHQSSGTFVALSTSCTHACCTVSFTGSGFRCPCHGATFDENGKTTSFIAPADLPSLPCCADANGVHVTIA
jgi:Rieske Fe-S protein